MSNLGNSVELQLERIGVLVERTHEEPVAVVDVPSQGPRSGSLDAARTVEFERLFRDQRDETFRGRPDTTVGNATRAVSGPLIRRRKELLPVETLAQSSNLFFLG